MRRDTRAAPAATMTAAEARQAIRDQALQLQALVSGMVSVLCDRLDAIQFEDTVSMARQTDHAHKLALQFGLIDDDTETAEDDWLAPLDDAIEQLRSRLTAARAEAREDIDVLAEEIDILAQAERGAA